MCEYECWDGAEQIKDSLINQKKIIQRMVEKMNLDITMRERANVWWKLSYFKERSAIQAKRELVKGISIEAADIVSAIEIAVSTRVIISVMHDVLAQAIEFEAKYRHMTIIHATLNR